MALLFDKGAKEIQNVADAFVATVTVSGGKNSPHKDMVHAPHGEEKSMDRTKPGTPPASMVTTNESLLQTIREHQLHPMSPLALMEWLWGSYFVQTQLMSNGADGSKGSVKDETNECKGYLSFDTLWEYAHYYPMALPFVLLHPSMSHVRRDVPFHRMHWDTLTFLASSLETDAPAAADIVATWPLTLPELVQLPLVLIHNMIQHTQRWRDCFVSVRASASSANMLLFIRRCAEEASVKSRWAFLRGENKQPLVTPTCFAPLPTRMRTDPKCVVFWTQFPIVARRDPLLFSHDVFRLRKYKSATYTMRLIWNESSWDKHNRFQRPSIVDVQFPLTTSEAKHWSQTLHVPLTTLVNGDTDAAITTTRRPVADHCEALVKCLSSTTMCMAIKRSTRNMDYASNFRFLFQAYQLGQEIPGFVPLYEVVCTSIKNRPTRMHVAQKMEGVQMDLDDWIECTKSCVWWHRLVWGIHIFDATSHQMYELYHTHGLIHSDIKSTNIGIAFYPFRSILLDTETVVQSHALRMPCTTFHDPSQYGLPMDESEHSATGNFHVYLGDIFRLGLVMEYMYCGSIDAATHSRSGRDVRSTLLVPAVDRRSPDIWTRHTQRLTKRLEAEDAKYTALVHQSDASSLACDALQIMQVLSRLGKSELVNREDDFHDAMALSRDFMTKYANDPHYNQVMNKAEWITFLTEERPEAHVRVSIVPVSR